MRSLPADCLESARIDGANAVQETVHVILPLIRNAIILCVTMNTIWQFQIFESVYMLTNGGPLGATQTVIYEIYQYSFKYYRVGFGAAASLVFLLVILLIYGLENLLLRERKTGKRRAGGMNKYVIKRGIFSSLKTITLLLLALIILFPFWQLIVSSLLETNAIISYPPKFWPKGGSVNNYIEVLTMQGGAYMRWMVNSLLVSGANTILVI